MFVRKKTIKGRQYYYLVRSVRTGGTVRQQCLEYLGAALPHKKELEKIKKAHARRAK
jgi:hypothetical protein